MGGMSAIDKHANGLPDGGRSEPCPAAVRRADIKWHACDADRRIPVTALDAEKAWRNSEGCGSAHGGDAAGLVNRNAAAATTQVQLPSGAPSAADVIERL